MGQAAVPSSFTSATWTGAYGALDDYGDATYVESPADPVASQTFLCDLESLDDPNLDTGHQVRIRARVIATDEEILDVVLALENSDDDSVIRAWTRTIPPNTFVDLVLPISEAEAALVHSYSGLRLRGYGLSGWGYAFVWSAVPSATTYVLRVGTETGASDIFLANVGNELTYTVTLSAGTYYVDVIPMFGATAGTPIGEQEVTVT